MLKVRPKSIIILVALFTLCTCIDPYSPKLGAYQSLLVIDGLITDANTSYTVKLSKTFKEQNSIPLTVTDATVYITDNAGNSNYFINKGKGIYKTDSIQFEGVIGRTYILHVSTNEGNEYESKPCPMQSVPDIDNVYFAKDQELTNNGTQSQEGIRIFLDSKTGEGSQNYRWTFEETWKFKVPTPKKFDYINDSTIVPVDVIKEYCWKSRISNEILVYSNYSGEAGPVKKEPIYFIGTDQSDRLLIKYSILVKQYSISKEEFDFWNNMKQIDASGGDIFAKQPFSVSSNLYNINNSSEQVLGYFQVSAVKEKREEISFSDIGNLNLPVYHYPCARIEMAPKDYPWPPYSAPLTWDDLYEMYTTSGYAFCEPIYNPGTFVLQKMVFSLPLCANCELTGSLKKPDFWVDLK